jgi:hypothetical protein
MGKSREDTKQSIRVLLEALSNSIDQKNLTENKDLFESLKKLHDKNVYGFLDLLEIANTDFEGLIEQVFSIPPQKNRHIIIFIANGLYEHFHETRIKKLEGFPFSADKSRFVKKTTLKALKEKKNLSLFADYTQIKRIKVNQQKQAFWSPKTIKDTDEAMELFWNWYQLNDSGSIFDNMFHPDTQATEGNVDHD